MRRAPDHNGTPVLDTYIHALNWSAALDQISAWGRARESRYVCICNVHSVVLGSRDAAFQQVLNQADLSTPDGAPVAWMMRRLGHPGQKRITGPDLMWRYCEQAQGSDQRIFLYGGSVQTLSALRSRLSELYPGLQISGAISPPFRPLSESEKDDVVAQINESNTNVVFVGLGCPKQEWWMAEHRGRINAVMIGVGAAFDFHAGVIRRAPLWMQQTGLEWLHRLGAEPRRLWRRYLVTNSLFVLAAVRQLLRGSRPVRKNE